MRWAGMPFLKEMESPEISFSSAKGEVFFLKSILGTNEALWLFHHGKKK